LENVQGIASEKKSNKAKKLCNVNTDEEIDVSGETSTEEETSMEEGISTDEKTSRPATQSGSVLSRMIACLVSMGYQVNYFKMHSEKYGSYQRRQRIILTIAAPGLTPIAEPKATHNTLEACKVNHKSKVTKLPEKCTHAPFKQFNAGDGIGDLPHIDRGTVHECIQFPDQVNAFVQKKRVNEYANVIYCLPW
jgi:site-specific DNA-cytosine methylase